MSDTLGELRQAMNSDDMALREHDAEVYAMAVIVDVFGPLDQEAQFRIIQWMTQRWGVEVDEAS